MNSECSIGDEVKTCRIWDLLDSAISYLPEYSVNRPWSHVGFTQNFIRKEEFRAPLSLHHRPLLIRLCYFLFKTCERSCSLIMAHLSSWDPHAIPCLLRGVFITDGLLFPADAVSVISICCHTLVCPSHPVIFCAGLRTSRICLCFADLNENHPPAPRQSNWPWS